MLSVILYGRNDSHGYNLHKRAAVSLNCIAEMLSDSDDEILFADYNTPNDLPTFIEAIYDTLTPKAKRLLRVFRIRPELHARIGGRTHLAALEPHARNIAIRRSNPANRWLLFTNTDMIFLPRAGEGTISTSVEDLADGQYILPRYELPEPMWESFSRTDPTATMQACQSLARSLHLDEITISHPYMRFDSPGDFQLAPRKVLFEIRGFDERMIHGWHADSNLCKRLFLYYGKRTESLAHRLKGYHCDHTRVATATHRQDVKVENDLYEFVYLVKDPSAPGQENTWGAPEVEVEEVDFADGAQVRYVPALQKALGDPQAREYCSDANDVRNYVAYTAEHVLPYVAANLTVYPRGARFVYVGNHPAMLRLLTRSVAEMGFREPLRFVPKFLAANVRPEGAVALEFGTDAELVDALSDYDLVLFDLGLDPSSANAPAKVKRITDWPRAQRYSVGRVARLIQTFAERSDERSEAGKRIAEVLVLNGNQHIFSAYIGRFLLTINTPYTTRTRKGRARLGFEKQYRSAAWHDIQSHMRAAFGLESAEYPASPAKPGLSIDFTFAGRADAYKDGHWGALDAWGCWTDGEWAEIVLPLSPEFRGDLLVSLTISGAFMGLEKEPIRFSVSCDGERLGRHSAFPGTALASFKYVLPSRLLSAKQECRLRLEIENPQSAQTVIDATGQFQIGEDSQELGVRVQGLSLASTDALRIPMGGTIDFTSSGTGANYMTECWTQPDNLGAWTLGPESHLVFVLEDQPREGAIARFTLTDVAVSEAHPLLNVTVTVNGKEAAHWQLGPNRIPGERSFFLPPDWIAAQNLLKITFQIDSPHSPHDLGWTEGDLRPLGFRLTRFQMDKYELPRLKLGETIDLTARGRGAELLRGHWGTPDQYGAWTMGASSEMEVRLEEVPAGPVPAAFVVSDCMVSEAAPGLAVVVKANGRKVAEWNFGPDRTPAVRALEVPPGVVSPSGDLTLAFEVAEPRTPASLGWSDDQRPLGIRLARMLLGSQRIAIPDFAGSPAPKGLLAQMQGMLTNRVARFRVAAGGKA